ncbi:MAG TPA: hypothetical protein VD770_03840, partial [Coxiellaceae bacterium]|nr:hypothetical protein [Coxiellaceae bacterium]
MRPAPSTTALQAHIQKLLAFLEHTEAKIERVDFTGDSILDYRTITQSEASKPSSVEVIFESLGNIIQNSHPDLNASTEVFNALSKSTLWNRWASSAATSKTELIMGHCIKTLKLLTLEQQKALLLESRT